MGSRFTSNDALPKFSPILSARLLRGEAVLSHLYLGPLRDHIQQKVGDGKIEPEDYNMVCSAVVKEYPVLGDADKPTQYVSTTKMFNKKKLRLD